MRWLPRRPEDLPPDERAIYEGPSAPSPPPELGPEHEWIFDDPQEPGGPPAPA